MVLSISAPHSSYVPPAKKHKSSCFLSVWVSDQSNFGPCQEVAWESSTLVLHPNSSSRCLTPIPRSETTGNLMIPTTTLLESIYTCQGTKIKRQELSHHVNIPQLGVGVLAPLPRRRHHRHHVVRPQTEEFQIQKASPGRVQTAPGSPHRNGQRHHRHEVGVRLPV